MYLLFCGSHIKLLKQGVGNNRIYVKLIMSHVDKKKRQTKFAS